MPTSVDPSPPAGGNSADARAVVAENLSKSFGRVEAVRSASFSIGRSHILGIMGSDGAGKTTLLRMAAGMIRPCSGTVVVEGVDVATRRAEAKRIIGYMPQRFGLYPDLTVGENVDFFMDIFGVRGPERRRRRERYLGFSNLLPFADRKAGDLSGGMKQKLGLACVLLHHPRVLILDEPTNGVDPVSRMEFWEILLEMKRGGITILVSTAYLDEGERCDRLIAMHGGRILCQGAPAEVRGGEPDLETAIIHRIAAEDRALTDDTFGY